MTPRLALIASLLFALVGCGATQTPQAQSHFVHIESEAEALCQRSMERGEQQGLVVALYDHGEVWSRGYGTRTHGAEIEPDIDTIFEIASITKTYTALLLADMVARGEVRLDQRLAEILPEGWTMDPSAAEVTIEQVITHRSGLPTAWPGFVPASIADPFDNLTEQVLREGLARAAVVAPPGSAHAYNNFAVSVLGLSLANRLHMPFEAALEARVLGPLGLRNTWMDVPPREAGLAPCGCDGLDRRACAPLAPSRRVSRRRSAGECA
jgi:CubicO group peptidase (beta-lactamase class C family)